MTRTAAWSLLVIFSTIACDVGGDVAEPEPGPVGFTPELAFPGRTGLPGAGVVQTPDGEFDVQYEVIDGQAVMEGDILLPGGDPDGPSQAPGDGMGSSTHAVAGTIRYYRWPAAQIFYTINPNLPNPQRVVDAIAHWHRHTPIRFVPRSNQAHYVEFADGAGCSSYVGMIGGRQQITLNAGCSTGNAIHEIGHAAGLWHEQQRLDRDAHVLIRWANIDPIRQFNYQTYVQAMGGVDTADDIAGYDLGSIMHYGSPDFALNPAACTPQNTAACAITRHDGGYITANRAALTAGDIMGIRSMYPTAGFTFYGHWTTGHGIGSSNQMMGDVNGDGRADAVVFFGSGPLAGNWYVSLSTGGGFTNYAHWGSGHGVGSSSQFLGDVNGDGRADAVVMFTGGPIGGNWYVSLSTGGSFTNYAHWGSGHGVGSSRQFLGDVNGDGRADAVVMFTSGPIGGNWYVSLSTGGSFTNYALWGAGHGVGSSNQFLADVNGDHRKDAVVMFTGGPLAGNWYVSLSTGGSFTNYGHWGSGHGVGSWNQLMGDVNGDGREDAVVYWGNTGDWWGALSNGSSFLGYNRWGAGHGIGSWRQMLADGHGDGRADAIVYFGDGGNWYLAPAQDPVVHDTCPSSYRAVPIAGDTTPPSVSVAGGSWVMPPGRHVPITAGDNDKVVLVQLFVDGLLQGSDCAAPYGVTVPSLAAGSHSLTARATDATGYTSSASSVVHVSTCSSGTRWCGTCCVPLGVNCSEERNNCTGGVD